jgi:putative hydrolase of the HAD superfamily
VYQAIIEELDIRGISWIDLYDDFEFRIADYYTPFPGLRETLDRLKSSGYQMGLISNGRHDFQMRSIRKLKIEEDFNVILISESEGVRKPDPEIFHRALHKLGRQPRESIFVGDHPDADIRGAHEIGMKTIWKRNDDFLPPPQADAILDDLEQLPSIIHRLDNNQIDPSTSSG